MAKNNQDIFHSFKASIKNLNKHINDTKIFENSINSFFTNIKFITKKFSSDLMKETRDLDEQLKDYTKQNSFSELYEFLMSFNKKIKVWADFLKSQTYFFDSIIQSSSENKQAKILKGKKAAFAELIKKKFNDLKNTKKNAVEKQKLYMKSYEQYLQFLFGEERYSNFLFKSENSVAVKKPGKGFMNWGFIEGLGISKKLLG